jgi:hypothetical protein
VKEILEPQHGTDRVPPHTSIVIYTDIMVEVQEYLYGSGAGTIAVHLDSGRIGNEETIINHAPVYTEGETCLFFLYHPGLRPLPAFPPGTTLADYYQTSGFGWGKWAYENGGATSPGGSTASLALVKERIEALRVQMSESYYQSTDFSDRNSYWGSIGNPSWVKTNTQALVQDADLILIGEAIAIRPSERAALWTRTQHQRSMEAIYTDVIIRPELILKGDVSGDIALRLPCGRIGNESARIESYLSFKLGEKTLLFLRRDKDDGFAPYLPIPQGFTEANYGFDAVGGPQGQWTVNGEWLRDAHNSEMRLEDLLKMMGG